MAPRLASAQLVMICDMISSTSQTTSQLVKAAGCRKWSIITISAKKAVSYLGEMAEFFSDEFDVLVSTYTTVSVGPFDCVAESIKNVDLRDYYHQLSDFRSYHLLYIHKPAVTNGLLAIALVYVSVSSGVSRAKFYPLIARMAS
ncbi:hypothetical protein N7512_007519 [Penicillium capsulatum]|nr:hypothetical protein N7512_007519 [Penicillium capsulatum]